MFLKSMRFSTKSDDFYFRPKKAREQKSCHSSYMQRDKNSQLNDSKDVRFSTGAQNIFNKNRVSHKLFGPRPISMYKNTHNRVSSFHQPEVFSRLWTDAENKNERLREIQVRRGAKENIVPHPIDFSSAHVDLEELHQAGARSR